MSDNKFQKDSSFDCCNQTTFETPCDYNLWFVVRLLVLDPDLALTLGVDEERVARRLGGDQPVLDGELIAGQTLEVPLADRRVVNQHRCDVQILVDSEKTE